jgi:hypothetical protein
VEAAVADEGDEEEERERVFTKDGHMGVMRRGRGATDDAKLIGETGNSSREGRFACFLRPAPQGGWVLCAPAHWVSLLPTAGSAMFPSRDAVGRFGPTQQLIHCSTRPR